MNSLKKAPRKKGASTSTTVGPDKLPNSATFGFDLDGIADIMEEESQIQFKAKVLDVYNVDTKEVTLTADQKELDSVLEKAKLTKNNIIKNSFVELKLYNNEYSLHGYIRQVSAVSEGRYFICVKLDKNTETDDKITKLIGSQKSAQNDGKYAYMIVRIHPIIYQAYAGKIMVEKKTMPIESTDVESGLGDQEDLAVLTEVLKDTGYVAYRKGRRVEELRKYSSFSGVVLRADVTGADEMVLTMRQRALVESVIDSAGNTAFNVYKAVLDRDKRKGDWFNGKKVSASQFIFDDDEINFRAFEDVAKYTERLWHNSRVWAEAKDLAYPEDKPFQPDDQTVDPMFNPAFGFLEVQIKHQGYVIGKGIVTDLVYDDEGTIEVTIAKLRLDDAQQTVLYGRAFTGGLMMIHREPALALGRASKFN